MMHFNLTDVLSSSLELSDEVLALSSAFSAMISNCFAFNVWPNLARVSRGEAHLLDNRAHAQDKYCCTKVPTGHEEAYLHAPTW